MYMHLTRPNTFLITGMNLVLVLQLAMETEPLNLEKLKAIVEDSRKGLKLVEFQSTSVVEKDFFGGS